MKRLLPTSLAGQLSALIVVALVVAHLAILIAFSGERERAIAAAIRFGVVDRVSTLVEVLDEASPELADRLAQTLSTRRTRLSLDAESVLPDAHMMSSMEAALAERLVEELALVDPARVGISERVPAGDRPDVGRVHERFEDGRRLRQRTHTENVTISIPLADGRWLNASCLVGAPDIGWSWPWLVSLAATAAATIAVVALLVRRITGPMRALAAAARNVGRGETVEPLPLLGPGRNPDDRRGVQHDAGANLPLRTRSHPHGGRDQSRSSHADHLAEAACRVRRGPGA